MSYSGDKTYAVTRDDIINAALRKIGEYDTNDAAPAAELADAQLALNNILAEWRGLGIGLWLRDQITLILNPGKQRYSIGPLGTPGTVDDFHCFLSTELIEATGTAIEPAAETSIAVDAWVDYAGNSVSAPAANDVVGVRLADGTIFWDTVSSATTTTVVLNNGVTTATEIGSKVYTYTTRCPRPHSLLSAHRVDTSGNTAEIDIIGRIEYERLSRKDSDGDPVKLHFDPRTAVGGNSDDDNAILHVWPVDNSKSLDKVVMVGEFYPDVFTQASDNPQFPREWTNALIWMLAYELMFEYEVPRELRMDIATVATAKRNDMMELSDLENASLVLTMDPNG